MIARTLVQTLKAIAISVPVTWIWLEWGRSAYGAMFTKLAIPVFGFLGLTTILPQGTRDRFIHYLPFLILMVITPRLHWMRRATGIVVGFVVIFLFQLLFVYVHHAAFPDPGRMTEDGYARFLPVMLLSDSIPFVLWILFAHQYLRERASRLFGSADPEMESADDSA